MRTNLIKTKELPKVVEPSTTDGMLDMVIAFDTTGSMSAYINAVKTHVKELVPKLFSSNPRGGTRTKAMYMATMDSVKDDVELSAVYTAYSKEVTD